MSTARSWVIAGVVIFATLCFACSQFKVTGTMVYIIDDWGISLTTAGLLMSLPSLANLIIALPGGAILQRLGSRKTLLAILVIGLICNVLGALAPSFTPLAITRFFEGLCLGMVTIVSPAVIAQTFAPEKRGLPMAIFSLWVSLGMLCVLNICNIVTPLYGWQAVWWVVAALLGVALILVAAFVKEDGAPDNAGNRENSSARESEGVSDDADARKSEDTQDDVGARESEDAPGNAGVREGEGVPGDAGVHVGAPAQPAPAKVSWLQAAKSPGPWLMAFVFFVYSVGIMAYNSYYPTYLNQSFGFDPEQANAIVSVSTLVMIVAGLAIGVVLNKVANRHHAKMLVGAVALYAIAMIVQFNLPDAGMALPAVVFIGLTAQLVVPLIYDVLPDTTAPEMVPVAMSIGAFGMGAGSVLAAVICGAFVDAFGTWSALALPLGVLGAAAIVAAVTVALMARRSRDALA